MVMTVASVALPVHEKLYIQKNRILPPVLSESAKRVCIVTGTHGDELEGQYVCFELNRRLQNEREHLNGIVDIYPALNPLGIDSISRGVPMFDLDMNRIFPGSKDGTSAEFLAHSIMQDLLGADMCIDIHASNIFLREIPQVRVNETSAEKLLPYARLLNTDFVWVHEAETVLESTLAYSLNAAGTPALVVEMGTGMRITKKYGDQLLDGIFALLAKLGVWSGEVRPPKEPVISTDGEVVQVSSDCCGIFTPCARHTAQVQKGEQIGTIFDPLAGEIVAELSSPCDGLLFTLRDYPVVYDGSLIARILGGAR